MGGVVNESYGQYRDGSSKSKKKRKNKKPLFGKGPSHAKAGVNPFAGKRQKNHRANINDSPFATKSKGKKKKNLLLKKERQAVNLGLLIKSPRRVKLNVSFGTVLVLFFSVKVFCILRLIRLI